MFNIDKWMPGKKAAETAAVEPQMTDKATLEVLEGKVRSVVAQTPELASTLNDFDMHRIASYVAIQQEKTGTPYTVAQLEAAGVEFDENILASIQGRTTAKSETPAYRVIGPDGFVTGQVDTKGEVQRMAEEERAA